jgi:hypothetical protein
MVIIILAILVEAVVVWWKTELAWLLLHCYSKVAATAWYMPSPVQAGGCYLSW